MVARTKLYSFVQPTHGSARQKTEIPKAELLLGPPSSESQRQTQNLLSKGMTHSLHKVEGHTQDRGARVLLCSLVQVSPFAAHTANLASSRLPTEDEVYQMNKTAASVPTSSGQAGGAGGKTSHLSSCGSRVYIYRFITYWGVWETRLFISWVSTWLLPTVSISLLRLLISLLRLSLAQTRLFSLWGYFTGRLPSSACQSTPGSSWGWTCLVSLVFASHVPESSGTLCRCCECPAVEILNSVCLLWWAVLSLVWRIISGLCSKWKLFLGLLPCLSWDLSSTARCSESTRVNDVGWWGFSRISNDPSKAVRKIQTRALWQYLNRHIHLKVGNCLQEHGLWCVEQCYFKNYWLHEKIQNKLQ